MFKPCCMVAVACVTLSGTTVADIIHVPGDYPTIQAAILAALEGDEIIVAPGIYNEAIFFNGHNITLRSSDGPKVTTIDATGLNNSVVRCVLGEGPQTILQGFTITGGSSSPGSGLFCDSSSPTVIDCRLIGNQIGMLNDSLSFTTVIDCMISNNGSHGMRNTASHVTVINCSFTDNGGHGMSNQSSTPSIRNCVFSGNGNRGMHNNTSFSTIVDSLFTGSSIGVSAETSSDVMLINCTVSGNTDAGVSLFDSNITLTNCIIWGNGAQSISGPGTAVVSYSDIEFGWPGSDFSILADPMFVDPSNGDYRLAPGSPCIDLANNAALPSGIETDLDGAPRFVDDRKTPDCPQPGADCGDRPIADMGAYEFQVITCPWDLNGDGTVGILDLLALLGAWGSDPGGPPDFDDDGTVGILDLLTLLANWGACA